MAILKQSVTVFRAFFMVLSSDHITGATGKTVTVQRFQVNAGSPSFANTTGAVNEAGNGWYYCNLDMGADVNILGDLIFHATASGCDPSDWVDQVQSQIFPDLKLNAAGNAVVASNIRQNVAFPGFLFVMTVNGVPTTGLTVTAQKSLGGAGFTPCVNSVTEIASGWYSINLTSTDTNATSIAFRFTAANADDRDIWIVTSP